MKKLIALTSLLLSAFLRSAAQTPFNTMDSVNINNINASILVHGDMWWNPPAQVAHCYFPRSSRASISFASAIWMSGYDATNSLHIAAQTYRVRGNDYWPGPLNSSDTLTYATSSAWAKIWKVNRSDIQYFQSFSTHTLTNTPPAILTWPGKGNTNAQGNGGAALTITTDMAPFVDINGNGIYEPLLGDYPDIKGDQALWWVFSDNGPTHSETGGRPIGMEVHAMAYGYARGTAIDNVVYYEYNIINKSSNNYHNFRFGQFDDVDLGWYLDDYIGFDSTWRMGIGYNGTSDDGGGGGHPVNSYSHNPPHTAITMIVLPGDTGTSYVPAGSFVYYNNDLSIVGNPSVDTEYDNYLRAKMRNGQHFHNDFSGPGIPSSGLGVGPDCNYVYPGDPSDSSEWSECVVSNNPSDQRFIIASNDFTLNSGESKRLVFAQLAVDSAGGCPATNFARIRITADTAWKIYHNPLAPLPTSVTGITSNKDVRIYPNPVHDKLTIEDAGVNAANGDVTIYNTLGQVMSTAVIHGRKRHEVDVSGLPAGVYYVIYQNTDNRIAAKFLKE